MPRTGWLIPALSSAYGAAIIVWQILRLTAGDRWWWLASANSFSPYLFMPLMVLLILSLASRRCWAVAATAVPFATFLMLYGGRLLPPTAPAEAQQAQSLRVMTFNVHYMSQDGAPVERVIRTSLPDLVLLQELNARLADDLAARLEDEYPYRVLSSLDTIHRGILSRYPLRVEGEIPVDALTHGALLVTFPWQGQTVLLLNVHAAPSLPSSDAGPAAFSSFEDTFGHREDQVRLWLDRVAQHDGPVIVAGDFNFTDQNHAYRLMQTRLRDGFRDAAWGLGHSFPARRAWFGPLPLPSRLLRLDQIWYSDHLRAVDAKVGPWDGQSDHLPVVVDLLLR